MIEPASLKKREEGKLLEGALEEILARLGELEVDELLRVLEGVTAELRRKTAASKAPATITESEDTPEKILAEIRAERVEQEREINQD